MQLFQGKLVTGDFEQMLRYESLGDSITMKGVYLK